MEVKERGWTSKVNAEVRISFNIFWSDELRLLLFECSQHYVLDIAMLVLRCCINSSCLFFEWNNLFIISETNPTPQFIIHLKKKTSHLLQL